MNTITSKVIYKGELRTESTHIGSGEKIITDAPLDNNGKGQAFSPTDMVANSLATCMLTIMGIKARDMQIDLEGTSAEVTKIMVSEPRRISEIRVVFTIKTKVDQKTKTILERAAMTCPVYYSLHPDIKKEVEFKYTE